MGVGIVTNAGGIINLAVDTSMSFGAAVGRSLDRRRHLFRFPEHSLEQLLVHPLSLC